VRENNEVLSIAFRDYLQTHWKSYSAIEKKAAQDSQKAFSEFRTQKQRKISKFLTDQDLVWSTFIRKSQDWITQVHKVEKDRIDVAMQDLSSYKLALWNDWKTHAKDLIRDRALWSRIEPDSMKWKLGNF
jgi:hypothetical protein